MKRWGWVFGLWVCAVWPALAWADDGGVRGDDLLLEGRLMRRLTAAPALRWHPGAVAAEDLVTLTRATPPGAAWSRVAWAARGPAAGWTLELQRGALTDAAEVLSALKDAPRCRVPAAAPGLVATCAAAPGVYVQKALPAVLPGRERDESSRAKLNELLQQLRVDLPDTTAPEALRADLAAIAETAGVTLAEVQFPSGPAVARGGIDLSPATLSGSGDFVSVWGFLAGVASERRAVHLTGFEVAQPRAKNGEWVVDFRASLDALRYRAEDETSPGFLLEFPAPALAPLPTDGGAPREFYSDLPRDPFGGGTLVLAGSARPRAGGECRGTARATRGDVALQLDDLAVVWATTRAGVACVMLVDLQGGCHEVRQFEKIGGLTMGPVEGGAATLHRYAHQPTGRSRGVTVKVEVPPKSSAPPGACRGR